MNLKVYDEGLYNDGVEHMQPGIVIYAEDPEFYRCYINPNTVVNPEGMSCDKVRKCVKESNNLNVIGIVDGDFNDDLEHEKLFKIDYYSIENIALYHHRSILCLKNVILEHLSERVEKKFRLKITFDSSDFTIKWDKNRIPKQFDNYINRKINCENDFLKYMDVKKVVNDFGKRNKLDFKKSLAKYVRFESLFSEPELERLMDILFEYEAIDIL